MFTKLISWVKGVIDKVIGRETISEKLKLDTIISPEMAAAIQTWAQMYSNQSTWLNDEVKSMNLGATISAELARTVTIEMKTEVTGSKRADFINEPYQRIIKDIRKQLEYGLAKGGMVLKPYVTDSGLVTDYVQADCFFPVKYDNNGLITAAVFVEQVTKGRKIYTRLEYHDFNGKSERITNTVFVSENSAALGNQVGLASVPEWAGLQPEISINNIKKPMFAYFRVPFANQIDTRSPLGVSVFSRAVPQIEEADKLYSNMLWEFESGERALYADVLGFKRADDGTTTLPKRRLFKKFDAGQEGFFEDWSPAFREQSILNGLDAILMKIEDLCGLSRGTLSNPQSEARTATEMKIMKQRSYATVCDIQKSLQETLEHTVYIMDVLCDLYELAPDGEYETSHLWDDSIIVDRDKEFVERIQLVGLDILSKAEQRAWYTGESIEEATKNLPKVEPALDIGGAF